jgi:hypothetical protein
MRTFTIVGSILQWWLSQLTGHAVPVGERETQWWTSERCGGLSWAEKERQRLERERATS